MLAGLVNLFLLRVGSRDPEGEIAVSERPCLGQDTGVLGFSQSSISRSHLGCLSDHHPGQNLLRKASAVPPCAPPKLADHSPYPRFPVASGIRSSYLCLPRAGGLKSIPTHTLQPRDPFYGRDSEAAGRWGAALESLPSVSEVCSPTK